MLGVRLVVGMVEHVFAIAVVGGNQHFATCFLHRCHDLAHAHIQGFHGFDGRLKHACVADHVAIGKIAHDHIKAVVFYRIHDVLRHDGSVHFRLHVVGFDFR